MEKGRTCAVCGIDITDKKATAKTCSPACRKELSRLESVTPNVTLSEQIVTPTFEFYTISKANGLGRKVDEKSDIRKAVYWYDVPIAAIPVIKKGDPEMPEGMNGRQYFLWWKNEFKYNDKFPDSPEILNPFPSTEGAMYIKAGEGSRHWGTV